MADIECLPGQKWNAHAVFADALGRAPLNAPCVALWLDEDGKLKWSVSVDHNKDALWMLEIAKMELLYGGN